MALNFSRRLVFPVYRSEENLVSSNWIATHGREFENYFDSGVADITDIVDQLPLDPFGMNKSDTLAAVITSLFEDFEADGLSWIWNGAAKVDAEMGFNEAGPSDTRQPETETSDEDGGFPHDVQSDTLLWRNIDIDHTLSDKITDDYLLQLVKRAQGNLQCLSLLDCSKITDNGLKRVLECNPRLTKLNVPGCVRLTVEGIIDNLRSFKFSGTPGIKQLRIGGCYGVAQGHFEDLISLVGVDNVHKPRFFRKCHVSLPCDDDRSIDIEICPKCENLRLVYDCPAESCKGIQCERQWCRGCAICIQRCSKCGRCINNSEYEETFSLDFNCSDCKEPEPEPALSYQDEKLYELNLYG